MTKLSKPPTIYKLVLKNITIPASLNKTKEFIEKYKSTHNYYLIDETWKLQECLYFPDVDLPIPFYIEKDRYGGYYSGADEFCIGKGNTQSEALLDLIIKTM